MKKLTQNDLKNVSGYQPRKERVKQFSGNLLMWINDEGYLEATSYNWWTFIENKNGLYFFNWYSYSNSTRKHQYAASRIMRELGIDYITVSYSGNMAHISLDRILADKINSLYQGENALALSRATKYAVYSENEFNQTLSDVKAIAAALKISDKDLDKMLLEAEDKANEAIMNTLVEQHERRVTMREARKQNEDLSAIAI